MRNAFLNNFIRQLTSAVRLNMDFQKKSLCRSFRDDVRLFLPLLCALVAIKILYK